MPDLYSNIPDLAVEKEAILRRRKIAEAMQAQAMSPIEQQPTVGRYVVPTSPLLGVGKVLQAYMANKGLNEAGSAQKVLSDKASSMENQAVADYIKSRQPTETPYPVDSSMSPAAQEFAQTGTQITPKTPEELDLADLKAQTSYLPRLQVAGALNAKLREQEQARKEKIAASIEAARVAAEGKAEAQRQHDETLRAIAAGKNASAADIAAQKIVAKDVGTQAKLAAKLPQAKMATQLVLNNNNELKNALLELRDHPGLSGITGSVYGRTPSFTDDSIAAQAKLDTIKNQIFVSTLQAMRASSKTGGAVGNVSDKEGERLENSMAALSRVQPTSDFKAEINKIINRLDTTSGLITNAFDEEYSGLQPNNAQPSQPSSPRIVDW